MHIFLTSWPISKPSTNHGLVQPWLVKIAFHQPTAISVSEMGYPRRFHTDCTTFQNLPFRNQNSEPILQPTITNPNLQDQRKSAWPLRYWKHGRPALLTASSSLVCAIKDLFSSSHRASKRKFMALQHVRNSSVIPWYRLIPTNTLWWQSQRCQ